MATVKGKQVINNMQIETSTGTVYWQEDEPLEPKDGDTWFKVVNGKATNSYNRENGVWVEVAFSSQIIAEELIGKIITGAEINGATINGTTINGSQFINMYNKQESDTIRSEGFAKIEDAVFEQHVEVYKNTNTVEERSSMSDLRIQGGRIESSTESFTDGQPDGYSGASLAGGNLNLTMSEGSGGVSYAGIMNAKLLESITQVKSRKVTLPNTANFKNATVTYYRWGQYVTVQFYFELLKDDGWVGLSSIEDGYKPVNLAMIGTNLMCNSYRSYFCGLYANSAGFRLVPSVWASGVTGATYQGAITYITNDPWKLA